MRHKDARKCGWGDDTPWRAFTARRKAKNQRRHKGTEAKVKALTGYDSNQLDVAFGQVKIFCLGLKAMALTQQRLTSS